MSFGVDRDKFTIRFILVSLRISGNFCPRQNLLYCCSNYCLCAARRFKFMEPRFRRSFF
jgi:hypothetical protein